MESATYGCDRRNSACTRCDHKWEASALLSRVETRVQRGNAVQGGVWGTRAVDKYHLNEQVATNATKATRTPVGMECYLTFFLIVGIYAPNLRLKSRIVQNLHSILCTRTRTCITLDCDTKQLNAGRIALV